LGVGVEIGMLEDGLEVVSDGREEEGVATPVEEIGGVSAEKGEDVIGDPEDDGAGEEFGPIGAAEVDVGEDGVGGVLCGEGFFQAEEEEGAVGFVCGFCEDEIEGVGVSGVQIEDFGVQCGEGFGEGVGVMRAIAGSVADSDEEREPLGIGYRAAEIAERVRGILGVRIVV
jgi:hypothetical protein